MNEDTPVSETTVPPADPTIPPSDAAPQQSRSLLAFGLTLVGAALLMFGAHRYASKQVPTPAPAGTTAAREGTGGAMPDFTLKDIHGNEFRMSSLKGKVIILDFWATWCAPCKVEIPWFIEMYDQHRDKGLEIVGVAMDEEGLEAVKPFAEKYKMNYRVLLGNDRVADQFGGIYGLPTTFIIGRDGKIYDKHVGLVSRESFEEAVKKLL